MGAEDYARGYGGARLCQGQGTARGRTLERATRELAARGAEDGVAGGAAVRASVGDAMLDCGGGRRGYVRVATLLARPEAGTGPALWDVVELGGYLTTDPAAEPVARRVLETLIASFRIAPAWEAAQSRLRSAAAAAPERVVLASRAGHARPRPSRVELAGAAR
jgi:hypothetical protein